MKIISLIEKGIVNDEKGRIYVSKYFLSIFVLFIFSLTFFVSAEIFVDNSQGDFDGGNYYQTFFNLSFGGIQLNLSEGFLNGSFSSRIFDGGEGANWSNISWVSGEYYGVDLPDYGNVEKGFWGVNMSENLILLHFDESNNPSYFYDFSEIGENLSCSDIGCPVASVNGVFGTSLYFDGQDDNLTSQSPTVVNPKDEITIEAWIYWKGESGDNLNLQNIVTNGEWRRALRLSEPDYDDGQGHLGGLVFSNFNIGGSLTKVYSVRNLTIDEWYHVATTYNGSDLSVYINGEYENSSSASGQIMDVIDGTYIGSEYGNSSFFYGKIDEVAIYNRSLSSDELLKHYKRGILDLKLRVRSDNDNVNWSDFEGPYGSEELRDYGYDERQFNFNGTNMSGNVLLIHMNDISGEVVDSSGYNATSSLIRGVVYGVEGQIKNALDFNGINGTIDLDYNDSSFNFSRSGAVTVSAWVKPVGLNQGGDAEIVSHYRSSTDDRAWALHFRNNVTRFVACSDGTIGSCVYATSVTKILVDNWYHVVGRWNGTNVDVYVNGISENPQDDSLLNIYTSSAVGVRIGRDVSIIGPGYFNGTIDEVAIWNRSLSDEEILNLYNKGVNNNYLGFFGNLSLPSNRYFQYNFEFESLNESFSPNLYNVSIFYDGISINPPSFSLLSESPVNGSEYFENALYEFNVTVGNSTTLDTVGIEFNGVNYTGGNVTSVGDVYFFNISNLSIGTRSYYWWANDTEGNYNVSGVQSYSVIADNTAPILTINSPANASLDTSTPWLNISVNEHNIDNVWISLDGGITNITYAHRNGTIDFGKLDLLFVDDFESYSVGSDGSPIWINHGWFGTAEATSNGTYYLHNETPLADALSYINSSYFSERDYSGSAQVMVPNGFNGSAYLTPRFAGVEWKYEIVLDYQFSSININKVVNNTWSSLAAQWTGDKGIFVSRGEWHTLGFNVLDTNISASVDGVDFLSVLDSDLNNETFTGFSLISLDDTDSHAVYYDDLELHAPLSYGSHTLIVYANDSYGNMASENVTFFVNVNPPISFSLLTENPTNGSQYVLGGFYEFNISVISAIGIDTVGIEFNGVNYTGLNNISDVYSFNISDLAVGDYLYHWWANDTEGNYNVSGVQSYSVVKADGDISLLLNSASDNLSVIYPQQINASANTLYGSVTLYRDGVDVTSELGENVTLGVGYYNYTAVSSGDANYSSASVTYYVNVTQATSQTFLYLNHTRNNITVEQGTSISINATSSVSEGVLNVYNEGVVIYSGSSPSYNFTQFDSVGLFNITALYSATQNYTFSSETYYVNVTPAPAVNNPPVINENYTLVNESITTPVFGDDFIIQVNASDIDGDSLEVYYTVIAPNGTALLNDSLGIGFQSGNEAVWNSSSVGVGDYGYWNWSYRVSDGVENVTGNGSFRVIADLIFFPSSYLETPDPKNETLIWNLSMYHESMEDYTFNFSYELNSTYFNLSFGSDQAVINYGVYNSSNLFEDQVKILINESIPQDSSFLGNITIQRNFDGKKYVIPIEIGIDTPSGEIDAYNLSGDLCSNGNCDYDFEMENDESSSLSWIIGNTGNNSLNNCVPNVSGFDISSFGSFSDNNFNLSIGENMTLTLNIVEPSINTFYGKLEIVCESTDLGYYSTLSSDVENDPSIKILVRADSGSPGGGNHGSGGGGSRGSGGGGGILTGLDGPVSLELSELPLLRMRKGTSMDVEFEVVNTGTRFLNGCGLFSSGEISEWIFTDQTESLSSGERVVYGFNVSVPDDVEAGEYETDVIVRCDEIEEINELKVKVFTGDYDFEVKEVERKGTKLEVVYLVEEFLGQDQNLNVVYTLVNGRGIEVYSGEESIFIGADSDRDYSFDFELPKNAFGAFTLKFKVSNGRGVERAVDYPFVLRGNSGLTGLTISEGNKKTLSIFGIIVFSIILFYVVAKFMYKHYHRTNPVDLRSKKLIKLDLDYGRQIKRGVSKRDYWGDVMQTAKDRASGKEIAERAVGIRPQNMQQGVKDLSYFSGRQNQNNVRLEGEDFDGVYRNG